MARRGLLRSGIESKKKDAATFAAVGKFLDDHLRDLIVAAKAGRDSLAVDDKDWITGRMEELLGQLTTGLSARLSHTAPGTPVAEPVSRRVEEFIRKMKFRVSEALAMERGMTVLTSTARVSPPAIGQLVDATFRVDSFLGNGAAGDVFAVVLEKPWHGLPVGTRLALKWYKDEIFKREAEATVVARRLREVGVASKVTHTNMVRLYDTTEFRPDGVPRYLVMEYLEGSTLSKWIKEHSPVPAVEALRIASQIGHALQALHEAGYAHRDVKPDNVLVTSDGRAVLLDMGVIRSKDGETLTESQAFLGTLRYAAPEWLFREDTGLAPAVDIYSLGGLLYSALTGQELFGAISLYSRLVVAIRDTPPLAPEAGGDPVRVFGLAAAAKMLDKNPAQRPQLVQVLDLLDNRAASRLWDLIRDERLARLLPPALRNKPEIVDVLKRNIPREAIDAALAARDTEYLHAHELVRRKLLDANAQFHEDLAAYLSLPPAARVEWVRKRFGEATFTGGEIEGRDNLADVLASAEAHPDVVAAIDVFLRQAHEDFSDMIEGLKQENP